MKVIIIEDGHNIALSTKRQLESYTELPIKVIKILSCVAEAVEYFTTTDSEVDLIISDIELSDGLCFDIFDKLKMKCPIIFATAYNEYWQKAFDTNSIDYLLKPISKKNLYESIGKFIETKTYYDSKESESTNEVVDFIKKMNEKETSFKSRFLLSVGNKYEVLSADQIKYIYSADKLSFIVNDENKKFATYDSLDKLDSQLESKKFFRINRKYIINVKFIKQLKPFFKGKIIIILDDNNEELVVSQSKANAFRSWLNY